MGDYFASWRACPWSSIVLLEILSHIGLRQVGRLLICWLTSVSRSRSVLYILIVTAIQATCYPFRTVRICISFSISTIEL